MAKLVYIDQTKVEAIKTTGGLYVDSKLWNDSNNPYFNSLVFTNDGHLLTHGIDFSITASSGIIGGAAGNIVYQSGAGATSFISTPGSNGNYVIQYTNNVPSLVSETTYKLTLNGVTKGDSTNGTTLGSFYAPETHGDSNGKVLISQGLESNKAPIWKALSENFTGVSNTEDLSIPTRKAVKDYVDAAIASSVTSIFTPKGNFDTLDASKHPKIGNTTYSTLEIGDAYTYTGSSDLTLPAANSNAGEQIIQSGDVIICTDPNTPKYTVLQANWSISGGGEKTVEIDSSSFVELIDIGGTKLKLKVTKPSTWSVTDTTYSFFVGDSGATSNAAVSNNAGTYLTVKPSSSNNATNILKLIGSGGTTVNNDANGVITINSPSISASGRTSGSVASGYENIGSITIGTATTYFDAPINTWRNVYVNGTSQVGTGIDTKAINFKAGNNVTLTYEAAGTGTGQSSNSNYFNLKIDATNTWREIDVYKIVSNAQDGTIDQLLSTSTGTAPLKFSNTFSVNSNDEVDLVWEEISSSGAKTYHV